jgi:hypothetical protein
LPARSSPCPCRSSRPWAASWLALALPLVAALRAAPSRLQASAVMGTASIVGEEVAVAVIKARQLGLPCCFACRATSVKTMAMAKAEARFAAPPGAGKGAIGSASALSYGQRSGPASVCVSSQGAAKAS